MCLWGRLGVPHLGLEFYLAADKPPLRYFGLPSPSKWVCVNRILPAALTLRQADLSFGHSPRKEIDVTLYNSESGDISMVLTGESLISRRMRVFKEERFTRMREIIQGGDVSFTNAEMLFHDYAHSPNAHQLGTYMRSDPANIKELQWLGINLVSCSNNHGYDFGEGRRDGEHPAAGRRRAGPRRQRSQPCGGRGRRPTWTRTAAASRSFRSPTQAPPRAAPASSAATCSADRA